MKKIVDWLQDALFLDFYLDSCVQKILDYYTKEDTE